MTDKKSPKFEFKGAGFEVGAGAAGEKEGALQVIVGIRTTSGIVITFL